MKSGDVVKVEDCFGAEILLMSLERPRAEAFKASWALEFWWWSCNPRRQRLETPSGCHQLGSTPGWVAKGKRCLAMGQRRRTVQNLKVVEVLGEDNLLLVHGAIPGADGDYVVIRGAKKKPSKKD